MDRDAEGSDRIAGYVLAGGQSSRMGTDKALLEIDGVPLLVRAARLLEVIATSATVVGHPDRHSGFGFEVIPVRAVDIGGPSLDYMNGIVTALEHSDARWSLIISADMPYLTAEWLQYLVDCRHHADVDLITVGFCNLYKKRSLPSIVRALNESALRFGHTMKYLSYHVVPREKCRSFDPNGNLFLDTDTPEDFERACRVLSRGQVKPSPRGPRETSKS